MERRESGNGDGEQRSCRGKGGANVVNYEEGDNGFRGEHRTNAYGTAMREEQKVRAERRAEAEERKAEAEVRRVFEPD